MSISGALARIARRQRARVRSSVPRERPKTDDPMILFRWCLERGLDTRPHYLWGSLVGARTAIALGIDRVTTIEFGVAGGNGLIALERAAALTTNLTGVAVEPIGFDTGGGMPAPVDHRDLPFAIKEGYFPMDEAALRRRLTSAKLVLGPVAQTVPEWAASEHPPIAFIAFDLDYYSSTMEAFQILSGSASVLLPRVACYFDDVLGYGWNDFNGERAAIADFNATHDERKIAKIHGLRYELPPSELALGWPDKLYIAHLFDHPEYNTAEPTPEGPLVDAWFAAHRLPPE
jgi:hypothetical protein